MEAALSHQMLLAACCSALEDVDIRHPNHLLKSCRPYVQHPLHENPARAIHHHHQ